MREQVEFLAAFLRTPFATGAVAPSSRALAERMLEGLDLARARTVVEVGPGTGAFTGPILAASGAETLVVAVEVNGAFAASLERRYPGLLVVNDSVERLSAVLGALGRPQADVVVCGLPWGILDAGTQSRLLAGIAASLQDGGRFVTFGYAHCALLPWSRRFRRLLAGDFVELDPSPVVWQNLPPAIVYRFRKRAGARRPAFREEEP